MYRGGGRRFLPNHPRPLSSFDTHARWVARNAKLSISMTTEKYRTVNSLVEERLCLVCKRHCIEDEKHFLIDCTEYDGLRQKLYFHISEINENFINSTDHDRTLHLLRLDDDNTSQVIVKYAHLIFQKGKQILSQKSN